MQIFNHSRSCRNIHAQFTNIIKNKINFWIISNSLYDEPMLLGKSKILYYVSFIVMLIMSIKFKSMKFFVSYGTIPYIK